MAFDTTDVKVTESQRALAAYVKRETGKAIKAETIAVIDALREAYRKDPERVAEREAQKKAARERKLEAYQKAVEKAAALAKSLGIEPTIGTVDGVEVSLIPAVAKDEDDSEDNGEKTDEEDGWDDEPEPEPEPVKPARKRAAAKKATVTPIRKEPTPADEDTSAIEIKEAEDGWEADPDAAAAAGDDFFDDGAEDY